MWWSLKNSNPDELDQALAEVQALHAILTEALAPATPAQITDGLAAIADMLQVSLPNERGLKLYIAVLSEMPGPLFRAACKRVAQTHKYARLPNAGDFLDAAVEEQAEARKLLAICNAVLRQLNKAAAAQGKDVQAA